MRKIIPSILGREKPLPRPLPEAGRGVQLGLFIRSLLSARFTTSTDDRPSPLRGGDGGGVLQFTDLPTASAMRRRPFISVSYWSGSSACGPSESAFSGQQ